MRHKKFNEVFAYTYLITRISDNTKYHGVRFANIKKHKSPVDDFGIEYFTSGSLADDFKRNPQCYIVKLCWTFDTSQEALDYEYKVNKRIVKRLDWANKSYGKTFIPSPEAFAEGQKKRIQKVSGTTKENCEYRRRQAGSLRGRPKSDQHKANLRKPKPPRSPKHCQNLSKAKLESYQNGSIKRLAGKDNPMFGKESANSGKHKCFNPSTNETMFVKDTLPEGWIWGDNPKLSKAHVKGRKWFHNPQTNECKMCIPGTEPAGFISGRK